MNNTPRTAEAMRCVVIVCAADRTHEPQALPSDPARAFDIVIWGCGEALGADRPARWRALGDMLQANPQVWCNHELVWLPEPDVDCDGAVVGAMCALMVAHGLWVAQPALDWDSRFEQVTSLRNPAFTLRTTNHVDEGMPMFRREFLQTLLPTLAMGGVWPSLGHLWAASAPVGRCAVLDAVTVRRVSPRPVDDMEPCQPLLHCMADRGVVDLRTFSWGGVDTRGQVTSLFDGTRETFLGRLLAGYAEGINDPAALGALYAMHLGRSREGAPVCALADDEMPPGLPGNGMVSQPALRPLAVAAGGAAAL